MKILDGKIPAEKILKGLKKQVQRLREKPKLAVVLVGENPESVKYIEKKRQACEKTGIKFELIHLKNNVSEQILIKRIIQLNKNKKIDGIIIQLPLPKRLNSGKILDTVDSAKDVDGLSTENLGRLFRGNPYLILATPLGVIKLLDYYKINVSGKNVVVIGRSNLVGKPLAQLLISQDATVTVTHRKTKNLSNITKKSDIIFSAIGKPGFIKGSMIKRGAILIDIGTTIKKGKLMGDVDAKSVQKKASALTPVPGGIGPMTVAMLIYNVIKASKGE